MDLPAAVRTRLWRARRRHLHIDALLLDRGADWELRLLLDRRVLFGDRFPTPEAAQAAAEARLRELQRAGWTVHW